jgi:pimeloyl-ACP methyl ester carboxylesterase
MEEYINIDGLKVCTRIKGEGSPFLILHGWGSSIKSWITLQDFLSEKFKVYVLDMPGFGNTPPPSEAWDLDNYLDFIIKYCKHYNIDQFYLLGHSFGGRISIKMAISHPEKIKKLILMDAAGIRRTDKVMGLLAGLGYWKGVPGYKTARKVFYKLKGCTDYCDAKGTMKGIFNNVVKEDLRNRLQEVKLSTLLIWGKYDKSTPLEDGKIMDKEIEDTKLIIVDSGHSPHLVMPEQIRDILFKELC